MKVNTFVFLATVRVAGRQRKCVVCTQYGVAGFNFKKKLLALTA
jgi:hypothetical protein